MGHFLLLISRLPVTEVEENEEEGGDVDNGTGGDGGDDEIVEVRLI